MKFIIPSLPGLAFNYYDDVVVVFQKSEIPLGLEYSVIVNVGILNS